MRRYLIVANQTLGGVRLDEIVRDRIERGDSEFTIVVPMTAPEDESAAWSAGFALGGEMIPPELIDEHVRRREIVFVEARRRAERRLARMIDKVRSVGAEVHGTVGDMDPAIAVKEALEEGVFDEVIVSTLPAGLSRWLKMDLPSRISRMTEVPVTAVEAEEVEAVE